MKFNKKSPFGIENNILDTNFGKEYMRTPFRYAGGKARALHFILSLIPDNVEEVISPFVGGGSVELALSSLGVKVHGYDIFKPLVNCWKHLIKNNKKLGTELNDYYPISRDDYYKIKGKELKRGFKDAVEFYVMNRVAFSGISFAGYSKGHPRFRPSIIEYITNEFKVKNLKVDSKPFSESIPENSGKFFYLDPPYILGDVYLYGKGGDTHKGFDHVGLRDLLVKEKNWILSYNNCPEVHELYKGYRFLYPQWSYTMRITKEEYGTKKGQGKEVLVLSDNIPDVTKY